METQGIWTDIARKRPFDEYRERDRLEQEERTRPREYDHISPLGGRSGLLHETLQSEEGNKLELGESAVPSNSRADDSDAETNGNNGEGHGSKRQRSPPSLEEQGEEEHEEEEQEKEDEAEKEEEEWCSLAT